MDELDDFLCQTPEETPEEKEEKDPTTTPWYWLNHIKKNHTDAFDKYCNEYHNEPNMPWWLICQMVARDGYPEIASIFNSTQFHTLSNRCKFICACQIVPDYGFRRPDWTKAKELEEVSDLHKYFKEWGTRETVENLEIVRLLDPESTIHEIVTTGGLLKTSRRKKNAKQKTNSKRS